MRPTCHIPHRCNIKLVIDITNVHKGYSIGLTLSHFSIYKVKTQRRVNSFPIGLKRLSLFPPMVTAGRRPSDRLDTNPDGCNGKSITPASPACTNGPIPALVNVARDQKVPNHVYVNSRIISLLGQRVALLPYFGIVNL